MKIRAYLTAAILFGIHILAEDVRLLLPEVIYSVPGVESNIYYNNIITVVNPLNYVFSVECAKGRNMQKRWCFTPEENDVGEYELKLRVMDETGVVAEGASKVVVLPKNAGEGRKLSVLMVGASQTNAGLYPARLVELMSRPGNPELTTIGTRGKTGKHEGYGGWRWDSFLKRWGYSGKNTMDGMHPNRAVVYNSPFLFPAGDGQDAEKGVFDLKRYFLENTGGQVPDVVSFQLGLNDFFLAKDDTIAEITAKSLANMELLIAEFKKLSPCPELMAFQHIPGSTQDGFGASYKCGQTGWQYRKNLDFYNRKILEKCRELGIVAIPMYINIDTEHNYPVLEQPVNFDNPQKLLRQNNGVHPAKAGYYQMGDTLYCWIKAILQRKAEQSKQK